MRVELIYNINNSCVGYNILPDNDEDKFVIRNIIDLHFWGEPTEWQDREDCIWDNLNAVGLNKAYHDKSITTFTVLDEVLASDTLWEEHDD